MVVFVVVFVFVVVSCSTPCTLCTVHVLQYQKSKKCEKTSQERKKMDHRNKNLRSISSVEFHRTAHGVQRAHGAHVCCKLCIAYTIRRQPVVGPPYVVPRGESSQPAPAFFLAKDFQLAAEFSCGGGPLLPPPPNPTPSLVT